MARRTILRGLWHRRAATLLRNRRGVSAVEFALILPVFVLLLFGSVEVSQAIAIERMVTLSASTVANLVTQYPTISTSQTMPDILNAASAVLTPYPVSNAVVRVSYVSIDAAGNATVTWSKSLNGSPLTTGTALTLPAGLATPNTSLVFGETSYAFSPASDFMNFGSFNLYSSVYMFPRSPDGNIILTP
jgi:Flp pilus assembly protein TadG